MDTARVRRLYGKMAPRYDRQVAFWERILFAGGRKWVCSRAKGETLEIAIGTGRNLPHYEPDVRLTGVDLSPAMLEIARERQMEFGREIDLQEGDAESLPFEDARFDTVVCTLGLCTIPDHRQAVAEARRVLRPGGQLLLLEHVRSPAWSVRAVQWVLQLLLRPLAGDHLLREPLDVVRGNGFDVEEFERSKLGIVERLAARKPTTP